MHDEIMLQALHDTLGFTSKLAVTLSGVVAALAQEFPDGFPDAVNRVAHARLPELSEAALRAPEGISALALFDELVALFPPPQP